MFVKSLRLIKAKFHFEGCMKFLFLVGFGGAIGSCLRFLVYKFLIGASISKGLPVLPWATIIVNIVGSFLIGYSLVFILSKLHGSPEVRAFFITGVLGGFTTFSAFSLDTYELYINRNFTMASAYVIGSVGLGLVALIIGIALSEWLHS